MYKALVIGCGNIGAMYDFEIESVLTYAKAFHLDSEIIFDVFDIDPKMSHRVAERYSVRCLHSLSAESYRNYDIVVICTPTHTHHEYLADILKQNVRLIICEKPIDIDLSRMEQILDMYTKSDSKVMVNFFRRFQPGIIELRHEITSLLKEGACTNIVVTYQRGFHNNASHAIDLIEFIFSSIIDFSKAKVSCYAKDEFEIDPTMSVSCRWNDVNVQFIGLENVEFSHFEVALYFRHRAVFLKYGGNEIEFFSAATKGGRFYPKLCLNSRKVGVIENHMINVVSHAKRLLSGDEKHDNFLESASISARILKLQGH